MIKFIHNILKWFRKRNRSPKVGGDTLLGRSPKVSGDTLLGLPPVL